MQIELEERTVPDCYLLSPDVELFLREFKKGTHAILFYDTPENKREILFNYLKFGERSEGLAYVCSEESTQQIALQMKEFGIDANSLAKKGRLAIRNYDEVYIVDGAVDSFQIRQRFSGLAESCVARGLNGLRAVAEMSCFFKLDMMDELLLYEYSLHRILPFKAEGICAYNVVEMINAGRFEMVMPFLRAHDPVIFTGPRGNLIVDPLETEDNDVKSTMGLTLTAPKIKVH